jgi:glycosyltransferase involved in cell wall biosynthesis
MSSVDVIVPCYKYGRFLRQCVNSVLTQEGVNVRVLIIDDASPDDTPEVTAVLMKEDSRVSCIRHESNRGHINTYNEGIEWACADYLLILSADDHLLPGALARAATLMDTHPNVGFTFGKTIDLVDNTNTTETFVNRAIDSVTLGRDRTILSGEAFFVMIESAHSTNIVRTPTSIVRTSLQKKVGGYRPELPHTGDLEIWLRLAAHADVGVLGTYEAVYRLHGGNMQTSYYRERQFPDLQQRKAAIDCFIAACAPLLNGSSNLRRRLLRPMSSEAIQCANGAFTDGATELANNLCRLATDLDPTVTRTLPWHLLTCKRLMGRTVWLTIRSVAAPFRSIAD